MNGRTTREQRIEQLNHALRGRSVIWFGIRGEDSMPLLALGAFSGSFAITAPLGSAALPNANDLALEELSGCRVDLDVYDLDYDDSLAASQFRTALMGAASTGCVLVTYRPSAFTSALAFSMRGTLTLAGMHKERQLAFENKPWVETELERRGVPTLGWTYVADSRRSVASRAVRRQPQVLRTSRNSGGVGIALVCDPEELDASWPTQRDQFVAMAPYVSDAVPVNLSGCVFRDGTMTSHPPSVQLIGVDGVTSRKFGYCGNDFGKVKDFTTAELDKLQQMLDEVGRWLHEERYVGAFGVDALVRDGQVWFLEVNARMQGSTGLSASIARRLDTPDLVLDHVAAHLGLTSEQSLPRIRDWVEAQPECSQLVVHNLIGSPVQPSAIPGSSTPIGTESANWSLVPGDIKIEPGGVVGRLMWPGRVTDDGFTIHAGPQGAIDRYKSSFELASGEEPICPLK